MNEQRVYKMTKLAMYEEKHREQLDGARGYYRSDYIGRRMIRTWIMTTAAFILMLAGWAVLNLSVLMLDITKIDIVSLGGNILFLYAALVCVMLLITYVIYSIRYARAKEDLMHYQRLLGELKKEYEQEEAQERMAGRDKEL